MSHKISIELSPAENLRLKDAIGERQKVLAAAVAEVYLTKQPAHNKWIRKGVGTLCLIKDFSMRSYYFKLFSIEEGNLLWTEEVYIGLNYKCETSFFHLFEGEDCIVGFNFANDARNFRSAIQLLLQRGSKGHKYVVDSTTSQLKTQAVNGTTKKKKKQSTNARFVGIEISAPQNFKHVAHVPSKTNEQAYNYNPELVDMFRKIGITDKTLENHETKAELQKVIDENLFKIEAIARKAPTKKYRCEFSQLQDKASSMPPTNSSPSLVRSKKLAPLPPPSPNNVLKSMTELHQDEAPSSHRIKRNAPLTPPNSALPKVPPPTSFAPFVQLPNLPALPPRKRASNLSTESTQVRLPSMAETKSIIPPPPPLPELTQTLNNELTIRSHTHDESSLKKQENKTNDLNSNLSEVLRSVIEERFVAIQGDDDESSNSEWDD